MKVHPTPVQSKVPKAEVVDEGSAVSLLATSLRHQTKEFFDNSTLHGVRYIAEKDRPFCEKFMWFSFTAVGTVATCIIIVSLWEKFQTNPTITGLDTDFHNWDVPFPAVTICDRRPIDEQLLQDFVENTWGDEPPPRAVALLRWLTTLSYSSIEEQAADFSTDATLVDSLALIDLKQVVFGVSIAQEMAHTRPRPPIPQIVAHCEVLFYDCEWKGDAEECCEVLIPVFTEMGFCYAFNSKHAETKWPWQSELLDPFQEAFIHETDSKWSFLFNSYRNDTTMDVFIHSTEEMAGVDMSPQHSWDRHVEKVSFSVKQTYTTADARQLSIKQRRCVFADELPLETSNVYTYSACMRQCRMQLCRSYCGCVPLFYPLIDGYRQCSLRELACIGRNARSITDVGRCSCELSCAHTVYEVEKLTELDDSKGGDEPAPLETEFVSWPMVRYKREVLFGWVDLLVSFGGIAGLFLGFSLLSGVELVYYFTLRACCAVVRDRDALLTEREERRHRPPPPHDLSLIPWWHRPPGTFGGKEALSSRSPLQVRTRDEQPPPQYSPPPVYPSYLP